MNADLEKTLQELGPEYRAVVDRLVSSYRPYAAESATAADDAGDRARHGRVLGWSFAYLVAATLVIFLGLGVLFRSGSGESSAPRVFTVRASDAATEYRLAAVRDEAAVMEMIRTQNPDGSWKTDFLTRQNLNALRGNADPAAQLAYRKACRNLRLRGLSAN